MSKERKPGSARHSLFSYRRLILGLASLVGIAALGLVFTRNLIDFPVYYTAGQSLIGGRADLYAPDFARGAVMDYRYPPFFLVSLIPIWLLPYRVAAFVWYLLSIAQLVACVAVLRRFVNAPMAGRWIWIVSILASAQYVVMILHYGNAHLLATSLLFISLYLAVQRRPATAALLLAFSITIKVTPVFMLPYFALKKQWRMIALTVVFLAVLNVAPSAYFGFGTNAALLGDWYRHVMADQQFHEANGPINLSLKGELRRYFSEVDYSTRVDGDTSYPSVNVASIASEDLDRVWLVLAFAAFLSGLGLIWWRSPVAREVGSDLGEGALARDPAAFESSHLEPLELGLMICLMLLVGPLTSKIYFIALLWPLVCLAGCAWKEGGSVSGAARRALIAVAITNVVLPLLPGRSIQRLLLVLGVDFYLNCLLMVVIGYVLARSRRSVGRSAAEVKTPAQSPARTS